MRLPRLSLRRSTPGNHLPWGWGIAWTDYYHDEHVLAPLGLNVLLRWARSIYYLLVSYGARHTTLIDRLDAMQSRNYDLHNQVAGLRRSLGWAARRENKLQAENMRLLAKCKVLREANQALQHSLVNGRTQDKGEAAFLTALEVVGTLGSNGHGPIKRVKQPCTPVTTGARLEAAEVASLLPCDPNWHVRQNWLQRQAAEAETWPAWVQERVEMVYGLPSAMPALTFSAEEAARAARRLTDLLQEECQRSVLARQAEKRRWFTERFGRISARGWQRSNRAATELWRAEHLAEKRRRFMYLYGGRQ